MSKINDSIVQRIKDAARIYDVVKDYVALTKKGSRYIGLCPFHDDRHATNFSVYPAKNVFKCFACGAKGGPVEFVMQHLGLSFGDAIRLLGHKYGILTDDGYVNYSPPPPPEPIPELPTLILPARIVTRTLNLEGDALVGWLRSLNWDGAQRWRLDEVLHDYCVGHSAKSGMTIWWQIDEEKQVRTGKMMRYKADGHRDKDNPYNFDWIHSALSRRYDDKGKMTAKGPYPYPHIFNPEETEMRQCLFGMHLLDKYCLDGIRQEVRIVESEKTAVIMAAAYGNNAKQVWMACGGLENLTAEKLAPVIKQKRDIIFYPDRDGIQKWMVKVKRLGYEFARIDTTAVTKWWRPEDGEKADIADVIVRLIQSRKIYKTVEEVVADIPALKKLRDRLDLKLIDDNNDRRAKK